MAVGLFILLALVLPSDFWWFFLAAVLIGFGIWVMRCCG
jgi:NO-binding membrane sensor protein with MHYT domain